MFSLSEAWLKANLPPKAPNHQQINFKKEVRKESLFQSCINNEERKDRKVEKSIAQFRGLFSPETEWILGSSVSTK